MTHEEKRFQAAVAAMQGFAAAFDRIYDAPVKITSMAVEYADALLAELDRTAAVKDSLTVQPDEHGWISHKPGDPYPCSKNHFVCVRFRDGDICGPAQPFALRWSDLGTDGDIIAWKPA